MKKLISVIDDIEDDNDLILSSNDHHSEELNNNDVYGIEFHNIRNKVLQHINFIKDNILVNVSETVENSLFEHNGNIDDRFIPKQFNIYDYSKQSNVALEIGFNTGSGALLMLLSNPNLVLYCFDIGSHKYVEPCFEYVKSIVGEHRIFISYGNSVDTVPVFLEEHKDELIIDLYHIDGSHNGDIPKQDLINCIQFNNAPSIVIMDDTNLTKVNKAWTSIINNNQVKDITPRNNTDEYRHSIGIIQTHKKHLPIIISMTIISQRIKNLPSILNRLGEQTMKPDIVYVFYSNDPYLIDEGISDTDIKKQLSNIPQHLNVKFIKTENIGPFRKILPLLERHPVDVSEPYVFITIDDDVSYPRSLVNDLYNLFIEHHTVVGFRGKRLEFQGDELMKYDDMFSFGSRNDKFSNKNDLYEQKHRMNFTTGVNGVLYYSRFFESKDNHTYFYDIDKIKEICETADDVWINIYLSLIKRIPTFIDPRSTGAFGVIDPKTKKNNLFRNYNQNNNNELISNTYRFFSDYLIS